MVVDRSDSRRLLERAADRLCADTYSQRNTLSARYDCPRIFIGLGQRRLPRDVCVDQLRFASDTYP